MAVLSSRLSCFLASVLLSISHLLFIYCCVHFSTLIVLVFLCHHHHHRHHHHVVPLARMSLTLSRYSFLSFIASGRSSGLHPVSSQSCCMYVRAGRPSFVRPYEGIHRSTSLMSSSLLFHLCPVFLVRLDWIYFVMGGKWPYSWCFVGCWRHWIYILQVVVCLCLKVFMSSLPIYIFRRNPSISP